MSAKKTAIVIGASQGIGAGLLDAFLKEDDSCSLDTHPSLSATDALRGVRRQARILLNIYCAFPELISTEFQILTSTPQGGPLLITDQGLAPSRPFTNV
jgi:NAD(P)-dependent dehydrogenase (short-subunit alcohol dehydrogenase family)